ncbi:MAG: endolytic transglycosylase MltG [Acidobacteriota bacterium]
MSSPLRVRFVPALLLLAAALASFALWAWRDWISPGPLPESRIVVLPRGAGVVEIANVLEQNGVIGHRWLFVLGVVASGETHRLKAGEYEFAGAIAPEAAAALIASGKTVQHRFTVAEGLTSAEIVALIEATPILDGPIDRPPAEGTLLPQTYFYSLGDKRSAVIERMERAFQRTLAELWIARDPDLPLATPAQAVVLASIVEKETGRDDERAHVAAVFLNRLRQGMRLQADPTVVYALTNGKGPLDRPLAHEDLGVNSPYNTYLVKGLPPAPIANPGLASLKAVLHPDASVDLYFVADGTGKHVFSKTLAEHNQHVAELKRQQGQAVNGKSGAQPPER